MTGLCALTRLWKVGRAALQRGRFVDTMLGVCSVKQTTLRVGVTKSPSGVSKPCPGAAQ
jgi:hypothetical protein